MAAARSAVVLALFLAGRQVSGRTLRGARSRVPELGKADDLSTGPVRSITCDSIVLPKSALIEAARSSGIHSSTPPADAPLRIAASLDAWYRRNGYVFAKVAARSPVRNGKLHLSVSEPRVAPEPVQFAYYTTTAEAANGGSKEQQKEGELPARPSAAKWLRRARARALIA